MPFAGEGPWTKLTDTSKSKRPQRQFPERATRPIQCGRGAAAASDPYDFVFTLIADPVGGGYLNSLARPGGNVTGFTNFEYSVGGKWVELLKTIAPHVARMGVLPESAFAAGPGQFGAIPAVASSLGMEAVPIDVRDPNQIEQDIVAFARTANSGLIVTGSPAATVHRDLIFALAVRLPAIYNSRLYVINGGLISFGLDFIGQFRLAASYVDRILKGEKPANLPVQVPTKYVLVINVKTANAIGLIVPPELLARTDEVIE